MEKTKINLSARCAAAIFAFVVLAIFAPRVASASADLMFTPMSGVIAAGTPFYVDVIVANNTQAINAVSGTVTFPSDLLSVSSISKEGSIIKLWPNDPSFSNSDGKVNFEGVLFNPGFSGSQGKVLRINFVPKRTGKANILFSSGSVLANDGEGTNVLGQLGSASFTTDSGASTPTTVTTTAVENPLVPSAPKVLSATHPDPNKWYSNNTPSFSWVVPTDVTAVRTSFDNSPSSVPSHVYEPAISTKSLGTVDDGSYYFHVQFKNAHGWGAITHFRFQIDSKAPVAFNVTFPHGSESNTPQPIVLFNTTDTLSGIDHYEIKIGEGDLLTYAPEALSNPYATPPQVPGKHTILVRAIDKAGNSTVQSADFVVDPIQPPIISNYPQEVTVGDLIKVRGTTYPDAEVDVFLRDQKGNVISDFARSNSLGDFSVAFSKKVSAGMYELTAQVIDNRGAKSEPTTPVPVSVQQQALFRIGQIVIGYFSLAILIIVALASLFLFSWFVLGRMMTLKRRLLRHMTEIESSLHDSLEEMKEELATELSMLRDAKDKRSLTKEETVILKNLSRRINLIENNLAKKFQGMRKDVANKDNMDKVPKKKA